jgi:hypothetical protein
VRPLPQEPARAPLRARGAAVTRVLVWLAAKFLYWEDRLAHARGETSVYGLELMLRNASETTESATLTGPASGTGRDGPTRT